MRTRAATVPRHDIETAKLFDNLDRNKSSKLSAASMSAAAVRSGSANGSVAGIVAIVITELLERMS